MTTPADSGVEPLCASLRLTAMTLRGVGSYLYGARLEIRPITILCGKNGSGKSTWLTAMNMLKRSLDKGDLPFHFDAEDVTADVWNHQYMNSLIAEDASWIRLDSEQEEEFGSFGTIGLEFVATTEMRLEVTDAPCKDAGSLARDFLHLGHVSQGTRFRLRLGHAEGPTMKELVELRIDHRYNPVRGSTNES